MVITTCVAEPHESRFTLYAPYVTDSDCKTVEDGSATIGDHYCKAF